MLAYRLNLGLPSSLLLSRLPTKPLPWYFPDQFAIYTVFLSFKWPFPTKTNKDQYPSG